MTKNQQSLLAHLRRGCALSNSGASWSVIRRCRTLGWIGSGGKLTQDGRRELALAEAAASGTPSFGYNGEGLKRWARGEVCSECAIRSVKIAEREANCEQCAVKWVAAIDAEREKMAALATHARAFLDKHKESRRGDHGAELVEALGKVKP